MIVRHIAGWLLIAVFGPAPLATLAASTNATECQMACCRRSHAHHCGHSSSSDSPSIGASEDCQPDCSRGAAAFGSTAPVLLPPSGVVIGTHVSHASMAAASTPVFETSADHALFQRPPPLPFS